jgi:hypothetical protein
MQPQGIHDGLRITVNFGVFRGGRVPSGAERDRMAGDGAPRGGEPRITIIPNLGYTRPSKK